jgi:hypothetical protein
VIMASDDGFVIVESDLTPSPETSPEEKNFDERTYEEFINEKTPMETFNINGLRYYVKNGTSAEKIRTMMKAHGNCEICSSRARKYCTLLGRMKGDNDIHRSVFLKNIRGPKDGGCPDCCLFNIRKEVEKMNTPTNFKNPRIFVVREDTFPPIIVGEDPKTGLPYEHVTIFPDGFTEKEIADKFEPLIHKYIGTVGPRLSSLLEPAGIRTVQKIMDRVSELQRPEHWSSVLKWNKHLHSLLERPLYKKGYNKLSEWGKIHFNVAAITSGRIESDVHKDFHQAEGIVNVITNSESIEEALRKMDDISNPETYMRSQFNQAMRKNNVTSKNGFGLAWNGKFTDDFDIHVKPITPNGPEIYYAVKNRKIPCFGGGGYSPGDVTYLLDFDANASLSKIEARPVENISVDIHRGREAVVDVYVKLYSRRTHGVDMPFTVFHRQDGCETVEIERVWPSTLPSGSKMLIGRFTIYNKDLLPVEMSEKASRRAKALNPKWEKSMGNPKSIIPNLDDFDKELVVTWDKWTGLRPSVPEFTPDVNNAFMNMAVSNNGKKKKYACEYEDSKPPTTFDGLLEKLKEGKHRITINHRDYTPGYIAKPITNEVVVRGNGYVNCHYKNKFANPVDPLDVMRSGELGNARFNENWFNTRIYSCAEIVSFVKSNGVWFAVVNDGRLPSGTEEGFPLSGGFKATHLKADFHDLRDRWEFCDVNVKPEVQDGNPMIGTFLTTPTIQLTFDDKPLTLKM